MWPMIWRLCRLLCAQLRASNQANFAELFWISVAKGVGAGYGQGCLDSQTARDAILGSRFG